MATPKKINSRQKEYLLDFMECNYKLLYGKFHNDHGDETKNRIWCSLSAELNRLGPPQKDATKWKKVYKCFHIMIDLDCNFIYIIQWFLVFFLRLSMICGRL